MLLGRPDTWDDFCSETLANPLQFQQDMLHFQKDTVPREVAQNVRMIVGQGQFTEKKCARASRALVAVRLWIVYVIELHSFSPADRAPKMSKPQAKKSKKGYLQMTESRMRKVDNLEDSIRQSIAESVSKKYAASRPLSPMKSFKRLGRN